MAKGILHLHVTVIILFAVSMIFKTILMLAGKKELLDKFRAKTKVLEMILGTAILLTGGYLLYVTKDFSTYMIVKIILLFATIPLGIIGFKKNNKALVVLATIFILYSYGIAKTRNLTLNLGREIPTQSLIPPASVDADGAAADILRQNQNNAVANAEPLYIQKCSACHGQDGKLMANGSKDLSQSKLTTEEKVKLITNGKNLMPGFKYDLNESDIQALAVYVETLKK